MNFKNFISCGSLRAKCFIIAYLNLFASIADILSLIAVVFILTSGFQCDVTETSMQTVIVPWLESFLVVVNLGTHGFYPFPLLLRSTTAYLDYLPLSPNPTCYPGMVHVNVIDVLSLMINLIWLKFAKSYVAAMHKNDPEGMRMFFGICVMKLILQILYFGYNPDNDNIVTIGTYWYVKVMDCVLALIFLIIVRKYMNQLLLKKTQKIQASKPKRQPNTSCFGIVVVKKVNKPQPIPVEKKVENV
ncbi:hypothetical protein ACJJTC_004696 [Scirpophaga incertulas]